MLDKNLVFHAKTKHIAVKYHFIQDVQRQKHIALKYHFIQDVLKDKHMELINVHTIKNCAYLLTKVLSKQSFVHYCELMGFG